MRIATCPGGAWLDVAGKAGVLFRPEEFAQFALEAVALLLELDLEEQPV